MADQKVVISKDLKADLQEFLAALNYDKLFVLTDTNTQEKCYPLIQDVPAIKGAPVITVDAGDTHKGLEALSTIWMRDRFFLSSRMCIYRLRVPSYAGS